MTVSLAPTRLGLDFQPGDGIGITTPWKVTSIRAIPSPEGACTDIARAALGLCQCHSPLADLTAMPQVEVVGPNRETRRIYAHLRYGLGSSVRRVR